MLLCRHEGVEQELPVLTAGIAFADEWVAGQHVVAVDDAFDNARETSLAIVDGSEA